MTDEELLLHQLKNPPTMSMALNKDHLYRMMADHMKGAADRIEALTAERDDLRRAVSHANLHADVAIADMEAAEAALAECLERNALLEARLGKAVDALLLARVHVANNEQGWSVGRAAARSDLEIINATLAEIEGEKT
jgi:hypothetical protein